MSEPKNNQDPAQQGHQLVSTPPNKAWAKFLETATGKKVTYSVATRPAARGSCGGSSLIGLSDATGSMAGIWQTTRQQIKELVKRLTELGTFQLQWAAYRDYCDGDLVIQASGWTRQANPLLAFIDSIECGGGGDEPEAVERALEHAVADRLATRVVLIGDAPPHAERDYVAQARRLAELHRPVFTFVVGDSPETIRTFAEISEISGGKSARLTNAQDLIDLVVLTAAQDIGGSESVEQYLSKYSARLSESSREYARLLLGPGG